jgi:DNA-binding NarL/FixJ family response regulator
MAPTSEAASARPLDGERQASQNRRELLESLFAHASARVIVLTTYDTDNEIRRAIKAGAKAYLLKDLPREELVDCIRKVHRGDTCLTPSLVEKLAAGLSSAPLTGRELDVLTLLADGMSNKEIGARLFITETTVKSHLRAIFSKLDVLSRTEAVTAANRRGLIQL